MKVDRKLLFFTLIGFAVMAFVVAISGALKHDKEDPSFDSDAAYDQEKTVAEELIDLKKLIVEKNKTNEEESLAEELSDLKKLIAEKTVAAEAEDSLGDKLGELKELILAKAAAVESFQMETDRRFNDLDRRVAQQQSGNYQYDQPADMVSQQNVCMPCYGCGEERCDNCFSNIFSSWYWEGGVWDIEGRISWAFPLCKRAREIYSTGIPFYQLEASYNLCNGWGVWANIGCLHRKGDAEIELSGCSDDCSACNAIRSELKSELKRHTTLNLFQIGTGVKYTYDFNCNLSGYLGGGLTYSFFSITNKSCFVNNKSKHGCLGGTIKSGLSYQFYRCWYATIFVDYSATKIHDHNFNFSTISTGFGVGTSF